MTVARRYGDGHRVMVTGGAGFVGSHLVDALLARGATVVAVDNLVTGSKANVAHLAGDPRFALVEADVTEPLPDVAELRERFDAIMHFASPASPTDFARIPIEILRVGSVATLRLLERAVADRARFIMASTSEAYGDPLVHPQPETYWGNVNPIGVRSVYDEAKRFSEAATMAYHRYQGLDCGIVRIFNSILADEKVLYDDGEVLRYERVSALAERIGPNAALTGYSVPAFDAAGTVAPSEATWLVGHPTSAPCFRVRTAYGRDLAVTADHSVFRRNPETGLPEARPVAELSVGDQIAIAGRLEVPERERKLVSMLDVLAEAGADPWALTVSWPGLGDALWQREHDVAGLLASRGTEREPGGAGAGRSVWGTLQRWRAGEAAPLGAVQRLGIPITAEATVTMATGSAATGSAATGSAATGSAATGSAATGSAATGSGGSVGLPVNIEVSNQLLWLLGLYVARGAAVDERPERAFVSIGGDGARGDGARGDGARGDVALLEAAARIVRQTFDVEPASDRVLAGEAPSLVLDGELFVDLWRYLGFIADRPGIPGWVLGLPLARLKWFIEGYRRGSTVGNAKTWAERGRHEFWTRSADLKDDLVAALARFGLVPWVGREDSYWRLTLSGVTPWSPLDWDDGVLQRLAARRCGHLVWAEVCRIDPVPATPLVYDFCVPGRENFWAGSGVMAHNTYGERMRPDDGRAIPTFIAQALAGEPVTVHGTGAQTRSICHVDDLVRGILALLDSGETGPINCGTEHEMSMRELAGTIVRLTGSTSEIRCIERTADDPEKRRPDLTRARTLLGYAPSVPPEEGLRRTIGYFATRGGQRSPGTP